jgi:type II secretory pathway component PulF
MNSQFPTFRKLLSGQPVFPSLWPRVTTAAQRRSLLRLIAVSVEENLPLAPLLTAWAADERGVHQRRLKRLLRLLDKGVPLPNAVESIRGLLRDDDVLAIRFDFQSGTRTAAIRQRLDSPNPSSSVSLQRVRDTLIYFVLVALIGILLISFHMIWITPQIESIFRDFSLPTPQVFQWWEHFAMLWVRYWYLPALAVCVIIACFFSSRPGRWLRRSVVGRFVFPLCERGAADVLEKLAISSTTGRPISGALSTLARYHFDPVLRHKLLFVRNELEQGAALWPSMSAVKLLSAPEERLLETAERVGNRPWVLAQLAELKHRQSRRRLERLSQLLMPAFVFLLGVVVLFQALALFVPLIAILDSLF